MLSTIFRRYGGALAGDDLCGKGFVYLDERGIFNS
jgi:hypothetical protein